MLLELLHALAEADSIATGPGVWGDWKASLIGESGASLPVGDGGGAAADSPIRSTPN